MSQPIPRPPSRSERLLRHTLRKDDTLRTHAANRPRSASSAGDDDDDDDDDFFQSAILYRCSRRNSAASALSHTQPTSFYIPDQNEHASYSTLLRSPSHSGSSRSGRSDHKPSPRTTHTQEKHEDQSRHHDPAPHEAVLRSRLDSVIHSMRIDKDTDALQSSTASLPSSFGSTSNSRSNSHESHQTHCTIPEPECWPERGHRHTFSTPATHAHLSSPKRTPTPPRVCSPSPRSPQALRSPPRTPSQERERPKHTCPDSPWLYAPLPPSPPAFSTAPSKCGGPAVVTFVASPTAIGTRTAHLPTTSPARHLPHSSATFDPEAASLALKELEGYVSFSSVAGLGAPPEEEDRRSAWKHSGFALGGKSRLSDLGLGSGKWWIF